MRNFMTKNSDFWFDYDRTPRDVTDMNGRRLEIHCLPYSDSY